MNTKPWSWISSIVAGLVALPMALPAQTSTPGVPVTWVGPTSGVVPWDRTQNWEGGRVPSGWGPIGARAIIGGRVTGHRMIQLPATDEGQPFRLTGITWTIPEGTEAVSVLQLNSDLEMLGPDLDRNRDLSFLINNQTGNASNAVVDLNGYTVSPNSRSHLADNQLLAGPHTVMSTRPGGRVSVQRPNMSSHVVIDSGVEIYVFPVATNRIAGTWHPHTLLTWAGSERLTWTAGTIVGNMRVGDAEGGRRGGLRITAGGPIYVRGSFTLEDFSERPDLEIAEISWRYGAEIQIGNGLFAKQEVEHEWGFTDGNRDRPGLFRFTNLREDSSEPQPIDFRRTGTATNFHIGQTGGLPGKARLVHNLQTQFRRDEAGRFVIDPNIGGSTPAGGRVQIHEGSRLELGRNRIDARAFVASNEEGADHPTLQVTTGTSPGGILLRSESDPGGSQGGTLHIDSLTVDVDLADTWQNGQPMILFLYQGEASGRMEVETGNTPQGFSHSGWFYDEPARDGWKSAGFRRVVIR